MLGHWVLKRVGALNWMLHWPVREGKANGPKLFLWLYSFYFLIWHLTNSYDILWVWEVRRALCNGWCGIWVSRGKLNPHHQLDSGGHDPVRLFGLHLWCNYRVGLPQDVWLWEPHLRYHDLGGGPRQESVCLLHVHEQGGPVRAHLRSHRWEQVHRRNRVAPRERPTVLEFEAW